MAVILLDTNIVSYLVNRHSVIEHYRTAISGYSHAISFQTLAELKAWELQSGWGAKKRHLLQKVIDEMLILHSDDYVAFWYAEVKMLRKHRPISTADAWIAATALAHDLELVTHNRVDFLDIPPLKLVSIDH